MLSRVRILLLACTVLLALPVMARAQSVDPVRAAKVQAAFLFNFARYATWPDGTFPTPETPLTIAVVGEPRLLAFLRELAKLERLHEREVRVVVVAALPAKASERKPADVDKFNASLRAAQAVYVPVEHKGLADEALKALGDRPVLTVSDARGFVDAGGMFELWIKDDKIVFDASEVAVDRCGLAVSSKVLRLAQRVKEAD